MNKDNQCCQRGQVSRYDPRVMLGRSVLIPSIVVDALFDGRDQAIRGECADITYTSCDVSLEGAIFDS